MFYFGRTCFRQFNTFVFLRFRYLNQTLRLYQQFHTQFSLLKRFKENPLWRRYFKRFRCGKHRFLLSAAAAFSYTKGIDDDDMIRIGDMIHDSIDSHKTSEIERVESSEKSNNIWELVMEHEDFRLWRRPLIDHPNICEFRCAGTYRDISALAFFMAQIDLDYRKEWDDQVISLDIVEANESNGVQVVRWLTHFPYPLYPREYLYVRRACVDDCRQLMTISSHAINHPSCPINNGHIRVDVYSSNMAIRPHSDFDKLGLDYVLTYCDDPKTPLPGMVYRWFVKQGGPRFLQQLHNAAKKLHTNLDYQPMINSQFSNDID